MNRRDDEAIYALVGPRAPTVRVTYSDTDRMGFAYYANYLIWFEIGRTELLRSLGQTYKNWEDHLGIFLPVAECTIEYKRSAVYDDLLRIETAITHLTRATVSFSYDIVRVDDNVSIATGRTKHPFVDRRGNVVRIAAQLLPELFA